MIIGGMSCGILISSLIFSARVYPAIESFRRFPRSIIEKAGKEHSGVNTLVMEVPEWQETKHLQLYARKAGFEKGVIPFEEGGENAIRNTNKSVFILSNQKYLELLSTQPNLKGTAFRGRVTYKGEVADYWMIRGQEF